MEGIAGHLQQDLVSFRKSNASKGPFVCEADPACFPDETIDEMIPVRALGENKPDHRYEVTWVVTCLDSPPGSAAKAEAENARRGKENPRGSASSEEAASVACDFNIHQWQETESGPIDCFRNAVGLNRHTWDGRFLGHTRVGP